MQTYAYIYYQSLTSSFWHAKTDASQNLKTAPNAVVRVLVTVLRPTAAEFIYRRLYIADERTFVRPMTAQRLYNRN